MDGSIGGGKDSRQEEADELRRQIASLPRGSISHKKIKGKSQPYLQWSENGKTRSRYLKAGERDAIIAAVAERKRLEARLAELASSPSPEMPKPVQGAASLPTSGYETNVLTGGALERFASQVKPWKARALLEDVEEYLQAPGEVRVMVLYGLRRTGKSTLIRQAIMRMSPEARTRAAYVAMTPADTLAALERDLRRLSEAGCEYVFVDEVAMLDDFVASASLFSDIYAAMGIKVVLSGGDSLGFLLSKDEQLYDRCRFVHTTRIPFREFESVLGIGGIDEFIRYGGTMSLGGEDYRRRSPFACAASAGEYVDSAIARNIRHSLKCRQDVGHVRRLRNLDDTGELASAIARIVEEHNRHFVAHALTRCFVSGDLSISTRNLRENPGFPSYVLDRIDDFRMTHRLRLMLEILESRERSVAADPVLAADISECLRMLDVTVPIRIVSAAYFNAERHRTAIAQPGLRYAQAKALVEALADDNAFRDVPLAERHALVRRVLGEVRGRMLEDIVVLETAAALPDAEVFVLQFAVGEFGMAVFRPESASCELYAIAHASQADPAQRRHLLDSDKLDLAGSRYGGIARRCVLYRGEACEADGIAYENVEDYLRGLAV